MTAVTTTFPEVALGTAFTGRANRTGTCPATLGGLTATDRIRFIDILGGQLTADDAGLAGGLDNVRIALSRSDAPPRASLDEFQQRTLFVFFAAAGAGA